MGKKRYRAKKISKGQRPSVSADSRVSRTPLQKEMDKLAARKAGKKVASLIVNPDTENLRKAPYIRVVN